MKTIPEITIQDFADEQGLKIVIHERAPRHVRDGVLKYYADFEPMVETKEYPEHPLLRGICGNGVTPQGALMALCRNLEGKYLVIRAAIREERRELWAPDKLVAGPLEDEA